MIAENGAVLHFPHGGHTSLLASRIPEAYLAELGLRGVPFRAGQCLVDADAAEGQRLLDVIRALELPLVLMFNRGRVMTLPQGVSKATGLHAALETLRASTHTTPWRLATRRTITSSCGLPKSARRLNGEVPRCARPPT